jgi:SAM-dependent methyltransferase
VAQRDRGPTSPMRTIDWGAVAEADVLAFADTVARVARQLARAVPAPRGAPLFGLDMALADPELLDRFSRHGIFRKYQRAIALGSGLGGVARWWSVHFGCSVLAVDPHAPLIAAAERLGRVVRTYERVTFRAAPLQNLPLRAEQFTHAWSIDALADVDGDAPLLREAWRVLRPAGLLTAILPGASTDEAAVQRWVAAAAEAGFIAIAVKPLPAPELPYTLVYADHLLRTALAESCRGAQRARVLALATAVAAARGDRAPRVMLFGERPS